MRSLRLCGANLRALTTLHEPQSRAIRVNIANVRALDTNKSGHITSADLLPCTGGRRELELRGEADNGEPVLLRFGEERIGLAARIFEYAKQHHQRAVDGTLLIPPEILHETPTTRALAAADSYDANLRTMDPKGLLDEIRDEPDEKLGTFKGGLQGRSYRVVNADGELAVRRATYDGNRAYLYVPASEAAVIARLEDRKRSDAQYAAIEIVPYKPEQMNDQATRLELRFDRPGIMWVSSRCPVLPSVKDDCYIVPGARFGTEAYYHDARINAPGARSTIEALAARGDAESRTQAERVLSAIRGTVNVFVNQINTIGKALNANLTVYAGRTQPPGLTTCIKEVHAAWCTLHADAPAELENARKWLEWATDAAIREYEGIWTRAPRFEPETGLSRYVDETPSEAPEEQPGHYAGYAWSAPEIEADAAIREHGWDSHVGALAMVGPDAGKVRQHQLLPICLNSLLYKYERDLADLTRQLGRGDAEVEKWKARAEARKTAIDALMWNEEQGLYNDLLMTRGADGKRVNLLNQYEDLRAYTPMWAGLVEPNSDRARRLAARVDDFMRKGGLATATQRSWDAAHQLNASFTERCQWGHKDIGWPITTWETVQALRSVGAHQKANEIAYRWCWMVQREMERSGGLQYSSRGARFRGARPSAGGYEAPITEKMDVSNASREGIAEVGYGNQGAGYEGEGGGSRWGYDAFKLMARSLPSELQAALSNQADPDLLFSARIKFVNSGGK